MRCNAATPAFSRTADRTAAIKSRTPAILGSDIVADLVFYARPTRIAPTHRIDVGEVRLACYFERPFADAGTILHFHGNGELASEYWSELAPVFLNAGLNVCFVDYRGYGASDGPPNLIGQLADNYRLVKELGIAPERLIVYGRSLGSLFATDLAHCYPGVAGLVLESSIARLREDWPLTREARQLGKTETELEREVAEWFDNEAKLAGYRGDLLVLHAANDWDLDRSHADRLYAWCGSQRKKIVIFPQGDHNSILAVNKYAITEELGLLAERTGLRHRHRF